MKRLSRNHPFFQCCGKCGDKEGINMPCLNLTAQSGVDAWSDQWNLKNHNQISTSHGGKFDKRTSYGNL